MRATTLPQRQANFVSTEQREERFARRRRASQRQRVNPTLYNGRAGLKQFIECRVQSTVIKRTEGSGPQPVGSLPLAQNAWHCTSIYNSTVFSFQ